jgi:hypothetical protein
MSAPSAPFPVPSTQPEIVPDSVGISGGVENSKIDKLRISLVARQDSNLQLERYERRDKGRVR